MQPLRGFSGFHSMGMGGGIREPARHQGLRDLRGTHISEAPKVHPAWPDPAGPPTPQKAVLLTPYLVSPGLAWAGDKDGPAQRGRKQRGAQHTDPHSPPPARTRRPLRGQVQAPVHPGPGPAPGTGQRGG